MNQTSIFSYSKKQNTVETSTFGSVFIALCIAVEKIIVLRYKLRMLDSESVVKNSFYPESRLNKKHQSCAYYTLRKFIATGTILLFFERGDTNLVDILTKSLLPAKRKRIMNGLFR